MIKSQRSDIERNKMIEDGKMIDTDEIIKQKQIINNIKNKYKNNVMILLKVYKKKKNRGIKKPRI